MSGVSGVCDVSGVNSGAYAFGQYVISRETRQVLVAGSSTKLSARAFDVLIALIERRDRVVSKSELLDIVWPGLVVEENNLQVHIWALRKLLGPLTISTIPGRGYRFTALLASEVEAVNDVAVAPCRSRQRPPKLRIPPTLQRCCSVAKMT